MQSRFASCFRKASKRGFGSFSIGLFTICLQNNNKNDNYYYLQIEKKRAIIVPTSERERNPTNLKEVKPMPEKFSRKREALYNALRATTVHPTAEWLYAALRPEYPDLSLGTVYRNLKNSVQRAKREASASSTGRSISTAILRHTAISSATAAGACSISLNRLWTQKHSSAWKRNTGLQSQKKTCCSAVCAPNAKKKAKIKRLKSRKLKSIFRRILLWQSLYAPYVVTFLKAKQLRSSAPYVRHRLPSSRSRKRT